MTDAKGVIEIPNIVLFSTARRCLLHTSRSNRGLLDSEADSQTVLDRDSMSMVSLSRIGNARQLAAEEHKSTMQDRVVAEVGTYNAAIQMRDVTYRPFVIRLSTPDSTYRRQRATLVYMGCVTYL
jgi:hypothetical protein